MSIIRRLLHIPPKPTPLSNPLGTISASVNGISIAVPQGSTVLDAIRSAGVYIPTLCFHPRFTAHAVCRMCLVDIKGMSHPQPACSTSLQENSVICTDTEELIKFRRLNVQMLLSRHPNECIRCEVSGSCKLQTIVQTDQLDDIWPKSDRGDSVHHPEHELHDHTSISIQRDMNKCIECGLCVQACGDGPNGQNQNCIGFVERGRGTLPVTVFDKPLNETNCISCGQCTAVCPVGALTERPDWHRVLRVLGDRRRKTAVQVAPATRVAIAEEFGLAPGSVQTGRLVSALRSLGFDFVFDTNFTADLTIMEEANELLARVGLQKEASSPTAAESVVEKAQSKPLPQFTSCCPGWINWVEINRPDLLSHLSTTKSPQQMLGAVAKRGLFPHSVQLNQTSEDSVSSFSKGDEEVFVVSIMPCTAKKDEVERPGMQGDVDVAITTRELARMIRARGIQFASLPNEGQFDSPIGESTGAGQIFGASGGVMEAALRTAVCLVANDTEQNVSDIGVKNEKSDNSEELPALANSRMDFREVRGTLPGVKVATVPGIGEVAVCNGIASAQRMLETDEWKSRFVAIEVMACIGGCLGGGGEPKSDDKNILSKRAAGIYLIDEKQVTRRSHENTEVQKLYRDFLGAPLSHTSERLLHTTYSSRFSDRELLARFLNAVDCRDGMAAAALFCSDSDVVWCTNAIFGDIVGRLEISRFINETLPSQRKGPFMKRHRLVHASEGMRTLTPQGEIVDFDLVTVGMGAKKRIKKISRHVIQQSESLVSQNAHE